MNQIEDRTKRPIDPNFIEKVLYARGRSIGEKMLDGPRLFDLDCELDRIRIRAQFPTFDDEQVEQELRYRLSVARQIDEAGIYHDAGMLEE
ncbi:MAG: hypothetical protein ACKV2Q_07010 [Planctomycetaceae bacterium]